MIMKPLALVAAGALVLSGCSAAQLRGTPATTPEECRADWAQERKAASNGAVSTGSVGAAIATIFVSAAISTERKQAANARFQTCMARFGVTDIQGYFDDETVAADLVTSDQPAPTRSGFDRPTAAALSPRAPGCPPNASVLYGGTTYCTGQ